MACTNLTSLGMTMHSLGEALEAAGGVIPMEHLETMTAFEFIKEISQNNIGFVCQDRGGK